MTDSSRAVAQESADDGGGRGILGEGGCFGPDGFERYLHFLCSLCGLNRRV